jgi:trehalose transport system permease protein
MTGSQGRAGVWDALQIARFAIAAAVAVAIIAPLWLLLKQAVTPEIESFSWPPLWLPHRITLSQFAKVFSVTELRAAIIRSLAVAMLSASAATAMGAMLAYAMARSAPMRAAGFGALSATRLLPTIAVAIPLAVVLTRVGLYDSPTAIGLALAHAAIAVPTAALTCYAAFAAVPGEVEEAAWLDGASPLRIFLGVAVPQARGAMAAAFILSFILSWDEFGFALLIQVTNRTLPPLLYYYTVFGDVGPASALAILMMIPAVAVVIVLRPMLRGVLSAGAFR